MILLRLCNDLQRWAVSLRDTVHGVQLVHTKTKSTLIFNRMFTESLSTFEHFFLTVYWSPHGVYILCPDTWIRLQKQRNQLCLYISPSISCSFRREKKAISTLHFL